MKRFECDMHVPNPAIDKKGSFDPVNLVVESAVIFSVFVNINHSLVATVQRSVKTLFERWSHLSH